MPKGSGPAKNMEARYSLLSKELDKAEKSRSNSLFARVRGKIERMVYGEEGAADMAEERKLDQRALSAKHYSLLKRVRKIEKNMLTQGKMAERVEKDLEP